MPALCFPFFTGAPIILEMIPEFSGFTDGTGISLEGHDFRFPHICGESCSLGCLSF